MCGEGACDHPARPFQFIVPPVQPACAPQAKAAEAADALAPNAPAPQANPGAEKRFQCTHAGCGYKTDHSDNFKRHERTHAPAGAEKRFQCTHAGCGYKTDHSDHFKRHERTHAPAGAEKRFRCTHAGCGYQADRSDHFELHLAYRHGAAGVEKQQKTALQALQQKNRRLMSAAQSDRTTQVREKITGTASEGKGTCECRDKDCMCWQRANALLTITHSSVPANWTCESSSASPPRARFAYLC